MFDRKVSLYPHTMVLMVAGLVASGCSKPPTLGELQPDKQPIVKVAKLYNEYRQVNKTVAENIDQLKAWAKKLKKDQLDKLGIDDVDAAFISPNDNEPYVLVKVNNRMGGMAPVLAYEKTGKNGVRFTVSSHATVRKLTDKELEETLRIGR